MRISVIIPTYNSGLYVTQALDSVLAQTFPPHEVLVIDDGSRDDTAERVRPYTGCVRYLHQENQGVAAARNHGLAAAGGELVAFLDADDFWHPRKLELQVRILANHPDLALLGTAVFDWPGDLPHLTGPGTLSPVPYRRLLVKNYFTTSTLVVRRPVLDQAGPFDTALRGAEDYDLWLRVAALAPVANLSLPLTGYGSVAGSLGKQAATMEAGLRRILHKLDERGGWGGDSFLRRKAHSYCDYSCAYLHAVSGRRRKAVGNLLRSLAWYSFPFEPGEVRMPLARPRLLCRTLWGMIVRQPVAAAR